MSGNAQHSSVSNEWGTPPEIAALVREVLGIIDLAPTSSAHFNRTVGATRFLSAADDALLPRPWSDHPVSVYMNPPGGKLKNRSVAGLFWERLMLEVDRGLVTHAIFMAFSLEQLQTTQRRGGPSLLDFPFCVPAKRIRFVSEGAQKAPTHANAIVYVPGTINKTERFIDSFFPLGRVRA